MSKYNVHAGHCPDGKGACGAIGLVKESTEAREVKDALIKMLKAAGHTAYDCTCDDNTTSSGCLTAIVAKCNAHTVDYDISIHLNAGVSDSKGNGATTGTEVLIYATTSASAVMAKKICDQISANMGYKNRGVKVRSDLYVLRKTSSPALLVECCFVDDKDDIEKWNPEKCAGAILEALTGKEATENTTASAESSVKITTSTRGDDWVERLQSECNEDGYSAQAVDNIAGPITLAGCPTLRQGSESDIVKLLQERLITLGYSCGKWGADGVFGADTEVAVIAYQKAKGLSQDGVVGPKTWAKLLGL